MDLNLTDEQRMLKTTVAEFVRRMAPPEELSPLYQSGNTFAPRLYQVAAESGWLGMLVPEAYGGADATPLDCAVVFEELGRGPVPGPFFSSGVLVPLLLTRHGTEDQKRRFLPRLCRGELIATLAVSDLGLEWAERSVETTLTQEGDELVLHGTKQFVHDAEAARLLVCAARGEDGQVSLVLVDADAAGVTVRRQVGLLASLASVQLDGVRVGRSSLLGQVSGGWSILENDLDEALLVLSAYAVGGCQRVFEFTVQYTRERIVFGQPIGRFQRVQDHVVELVDHTDAARWVTYEAIWKLESGAVSRPSASAHEARAVASEAYYQACNYSHMVHAGPGTALDHPLVAHTLTSRSLYQYLGNPEFHKRRMMNLRFPMTA